MSLKLRIIAASLMVLVGLLPYFYFGFVVDPNQVTRDPNIGAGLIELFGLLLSGIGGIWLVVEILKPGKGQLN